MSDLFKNCLTRLKEIFTKGEDDLQSESRIESARITSNRLQALQRMRLNSPTTPDYKLEDAETTGKPATGKQQQYTKLDDIELDFGMTVGHSTTLP